MFLNYQTNYHFFLVLSFSYAFTSLVQSKKSRKCETTFYVKCVNYLTNSLKLLLIQYWEKFIEKQMPFSDNFSIGEVLID